MLAGTGKRVVLMIPTLLFISVLAFAMLYYAPGDTAMLVLKERTHVSTLTDEDAPAFAERQGLNAGFGALYAGWMGGVLRGDLGTSYIELIAWLVYTVLGTAVGMLAAVYHNGVFDRVTKYWAVLSTAIPVFWISMFVVWPLSVKLGVLTTVGKRSDLSFIPPGVLMGLVYTGNLIVIVKEKTRLVLKEPFVLSARAMGVKRHVILKRHVLKNILPPVVATSPLGFSSFIGSGVLMHAISVKDYMIVASATLILGVLVCCAPYTGFAIPSCWHSLPRRFPFPLVCCWATTAVFYQFSNLVLSLPMMILGILLAALTNSSIWVLILLIIQTGSSQTRKS